MGRPVRFDATTTPVAAAVAAFLLVALSIIAFRVVKQRAEKTRISAAAFHVEDLSLPLNGAATEGVSTWEEYDQLVDRKALAFEIALARGFSQIGMARADIEQLLQTDYWPCADVPDCLEFLYDPGYKGVRLYFDAGRLVRYEKFNT